jgi:hypothetical protein
MRYYALAVVLVIALLCGCVGGSDSTSDENSSSTAPPSIGTTTPAPSYEKFEGNIENLFPSGDDLPNPNIEAEPNDNCGVPDPEYCEGYKMNIYYGREDATIAAIWVYKVDQDTLERLVSRKGVIIEDMLLDTPVSRDAGINADNYSFCGGCVNEKVCGYQLQFTYKDIHITIMIGNSEDAKKEWLIDEAVRYANIIIDNLHEY